MIYLIHSNSIFLFKYFNYYRNEVSKDLNQVFDLFANASKRDYIFMLDGVIIILGMNHKK